MILEVSFLFALVEVSYRFSLLFGLLLTYVPEGPMRTYRVTVYLIVGT